MATAAASLRTRQPLRILIADDHDLMRRGLKSLLESHPGWSVCAEAQTGTEAVVKAEETNPDIAILDVAMPELDGVEVARRIKKSSPKAEILVLSAYRSDQLIRHAVDAGARGYVNKLDSDQDLIIAVQALANHKTFFTPVAAESILSNFNIAGVRSQMPDVSADRLTSRERQVLQLISHGNNSKDVAATLGISVKTAETHRTNMMRKLGVHSVSELVRYALRNQIVEP